MIRELLTSLKSPSTSQA